VWPLAARAQQPKVWRIGFLASVPPTPVILSAFRDGMRERGYVEGPNGDLTAKRIELLHEVLPKAAVVAFLVNPNNRFTETETLILQDGARSLGLELHVVPASHYQRD